MPAIRAVASTSPLGALPSATARAVSGETLTAARASARRSVAGLAPTSTMRARPLSSRWVSSGMDAHRVLDQLADALHIAGAQQLDRVGLSVDDRLEEPLAVLVGGEGGLGPAAHLVEDHRK